MQTRQLGKNGPKVSAVGLGCMNMTEGAPLPDRAESIATIREALDAGITFLNTGDFYGMGRNEMLVGEALKGRRDKAVISVKMGGLRDPKGAFYGFDFRPEHLKNYLTYSLNRLGTDYIDIYEPSRVDPQIPIEDIIGALKDLVQAGYIRHIGLSEAGAESVRRATRIHPVAALEIEYSLVGRGAEAEILPEARKAGAGIVAYSVLSFGLLSGRLTRDSLKPSEFRAHLPRYQGENLEKNLKLVERFGALAAARSATPTQLAFAWVLAKGTDIVPLIGAKRRDQLKEALGALEIRLTARDLDEIETAIPADAVAGTLYGGFVQDQIDAERKKR